jgi:hypothetical protein
MSIVELLPAVRSLSRGDKLRLIQMLAAELAQEEAPTPLVPGQCYPLWSPVQAYDAAAVLLGMLEAERTEP